MGKLLFWVLVSSALWITCVVKWFGHHDHAALGFLMLSMVTANYANSQAQAYIRKRRYL